MGQLCIPLSDTVPLFVEAWKLLVGRLPAHTIEETDGVVSCFGNVPLLFLNISIVTRPAGTNDELRTQLKTAARHASTCKYPAGVLLREDWLPAGWEQPVQETGLVQIVAMTGMDAEELLPPRRPAAALDIRRVVNDQMGRDLAMLNSLAYQMPAEEFECIANMHLWHADSYAYVGYRNGKPVSCASALPVAGTVYIALVATAPEAQGRGHAETLVRQAVTEGQKAMGTSRTTLHASDMGLPVYRAMGYQPGPRVILFGAA